jgi:DNA-directed RNA polymerase specialized sigma24 family protein
MSEIPEGVHGERVRELSDRFAFHLERWARGRTPVWARHSVDSQNLVRQTLIEVAHSGEIDRPENDWRPLTAIRRLLYQNVREHVRTLHNPGGLTSQSSLRDPVLETELLAEYESALSRLSSGDRDAVIARAELGLPWSDVIGLLGKPGAATARIAVSRALVRLAREMSHDRNE